MKLNKPINEFKKEEIKDICKFIRLFPENDKTKPCDYGWVTCHFAGGKHCDRRPIEEWESDEANFRAI